METRDVNDSESSAIQSVEVACNTGTGASSSRVSIEGSLGFGFPLRMVARQGQEAAPNQVVDLDPPEMDNPASSKSGGESKAVRCMTKRHEALNERLGRERQRAWENGWHTWLLAENERIVAPVGFLLPDTPFCAAKRVLGEYHLRCWTCGLTHITARLKAVSTSACAYARIASGVELLDVARVPLCPQVVPQFKMSLEALNKRSDRKGKALAHPVGK